METKKTHSQIKRLPFSLQEILAEPITRYTLIISLTLSSVILLDAIYPQFVIWSSKAGFYWFQENYPIFATSDDRIFSQVIIEWFGVFVGFLLPLVLVRAWEQLDRADREFAREADTIKVLLEDILLLDNAYLSFKKNMIRNLHDYVFHVIKNYNTEHLYEEGAGRETGDKLLQGIRAGYKDLLYHGNKGQRTSYLDPVTTELLERLNDAIDIRGDRISLFRERVFGSLRIVTTPAVLIWLISFYFLPYELGILGSVLKLAVTFLVIFILTIIDDLDDPFKGFWRISTSTWQEVLYETSTSLEELDQNMEKVKEQTDNNAKKYRRRAIKKE